MGCYGIGVTRLLAVALEHFTTTMTKKDPPTELRWPLGFAPFSGAIALQKVGYIYQNTCYLHLIVVVIVLLYRVPPTTLCQLTNSTVFWPTLASIHDHQQAQNLIRNFSRGYSRVVTYQWMTDLTLVLDGSCLTCANLVYRGFSLPRYRVAPSSQLHIY